MVHLRAPGIALRPQWLLCLGTSDLSKAVRCESAVAMSSWPYRLPSLHLALGWRWDGFIEVGSEEKRPGPDGKPDPCSIVGSLAEDQGVGLPVSLPRWLMLRPWRLMGVGDWLVEDGEEESKLESRAGTNVSFKTGQGDSGC